MVQQLPLNGRYFLDLGLLVTGSVTPSQAAFSAVPMRGLGPLAINTGGNREETVNYLINGITLNNLTFGSISFQPSISTVQEFKVDNSTFSAEYGGSSGAIVNTATRSGTNEFSAIYELRFRGNRCVDGWQLFITTIGDAKMRMQALRAGAVEFLTKPFDVEVLLDSVRAALDS